MGTRGPQRKLSRTFTMSALSDIMDPEVVPSSLASVAPILRVANEINDSAPRVAYLCRFYAFQKAHSQDQKSEGRGVRQFKTALLHTLERDDQPTRDRTSLTDARLMEKYYQDYYDKYVKSLESPDSLNMDRAQLARTYQMAAVLFEVLKAVTLIDPYKIGEETEKKAEDVKDKQRLYVQYNILPLDPRGAQQPIMVLPEIQAAVHALQNTRGLTLSPEVEASRQKGTEYDLLDWLQSMFGFQKDNVANQREHIILLLANVHIRQIPKTEQKIKLDDRALDVVTKGLFENYKRWCKFLGRKSNLGLPTIQQEIQQRKILYMGLYLLIWGEAANLRFMPECLCYIFHNMAYELYGMLAGNVSSVTGENIKPAYGGGENAFLQEVVTPLYKVVAEEVDFSSKGKIAHSEWRNYDDLNEYFWSVDCFSLGWPMRTDLGFFKSPRDKKIPFLQGISAKKRQYSWPGKTNFVEVRSFLHVFRSFDRMWSFFILALQAMVIVAWNGSGQIGDVFKAAVFKKVLSIFITAAILRLLQAIVDIGLSMKAWRSMKLTDMLRYWLKLVVAVVWVIVLPVCYAHTWGNPTGFVSTLKNWFGQTSGSPALYVTAVIVYLIPNALGALIFLFPMLRRGIEQSNWGVVQLLLWWAQPPLYIGRGMHESQYTLIKYTLFWVLLLISKFLFSYYVEVKPLVEPTKRIMEASTAGQYQWHELFPKVKHNLGVVLALWAPIVMVYFMDTQIWYAVWSTVFGGINGAFARLGEIRTLAMLRSRFLSLPGAVNSNLVPAAEKPDKPAHRPFSLRRSYQKVLSGNSLEVAKFSQLWNSVIESLRDEDFIDNRERELLLMPFPSDPSMKLVQWPPFLLASKIPIALDTAKDFTDALNDDELIKRISADEYMKCAIQECYELFTLVLRVLVNGDKEKRIIEELIKEVEDNIAEKTLLQALKMSELHLLYEKFVELVEILKEGDAQKAEQVTYILQDMYEVYTRDIRDVQKRPNIEPESSHGGSVGKLEGKFESFHQRNRQLFEKDAICFPLQPSNSCKEQINRLHLLLDTKETVMDVPANLEARRRIAFFTNSLFMDMPPAPKVRNMLSFSVLTPYYNEEILHTRKNLEDENEDGISILYYLQKIYPDEWNNFLQRTGSSDSSWASNRSTESDEKDDREVRNWASYRSQTLTRTVRGMMYYRKALELQTFLDMGPKEVIMLGYARALEVTESEQELRKLSATIQAVADMKFTYVVTCQNYAMQKRTQDPHANDIAQLMQQYPALRVAYIDEMEEDKKKVYYSVLAKGTKTSTDEVVYKIKLPGNPILGEGKPENQNHAIIFTRGEALQAIDMNQDNYLEEAFKMRNLLQEFLGVYGVGNPSVLGMRENIFTGSVSSLAGFMSNQESSFVTIGQRVLANPLKVRFHYGHPDVFNRLFHITRGGISKASRGVNLSEDIFAGFNTILRRGNVTHHEYIQVGKGRDVGLNQICLFEAKVANGNGEQTISRDIYRLGHRVDFFRMLSVYFTTVGFYINTLIVVLTVFVFLYGRIYLALSGLEQSLVHYAGLQKNKPLQVALASQSFVQIGLLMALPMVMEIGLERGFRRALSEFIVMQLQLASVFFTFTLGARVHFYGRTLLHGGAKYRSTGRGFVVFHAKFAENYRLYSRSHFTKGLELLTLLIVYEVYGASGHKTVAYVLMTFSLWFLVGTWLFAPFLFNPSGFEWQKIVDDWDDWNKWIGNRGGIGVPASKSWESWWEEEQEHLKLSGVWGRLIEVLLLARFFLYQYGLVYHLNIVQHKKSILVYALSWLVIVFFLVMLKGVSIGQKRLSADYQLLFRLLKGAVFVALLTLLIITFVVGNLTIGDVFASILAFMPTGWALLQIAQACDKFVKKAGMWDSVKALARGYEYMMALVLFAPVATLAWFPFISDFQTRLLFNQAFSRGLQISRILAGRREKKAN